MTEVARPQERYGAPPRLRRPVLIATIGSMVAVGLAWTAWAVFSHSTPEVRSDLLGWAVEDGSQLTARVSVVRRHEDTAASCSVRALAEDHGVVGVLTFPVESGPERQDVTVTVRTERLASAVEMVGCTAPGQPRPR